MDDGIETTKLVDLVGDGRHFQNARQVAADDVLGASDVFAGLFHPRCAAGVQNDLMALPD